eukprot:Sspe_Gene.110695::Locus_91756_Transcript_1_1_Confidence_1.000_Length_641::g.110695::m.110695
MEYGGASFEELLGQVSRGIDSTPASKSFPAPPRPATPSVQQETVHSDTETLRMVKEALRQTEALADRVNSLQAMCESRHTTKQAYDELLEECKRAFDEGKGLESRVKRVELQLQEVEDERDRLRADNAALTERIKELELGQSPKPSVPSRSDLAFLRLLDTRLEELKMDGLKLATRTAGLVVSLERKR